MISPSSCLNTNEIRFYAIGDFGYPSPEMKRVASAMQLYSEMNGPPNFILGLGDNFYPSGVDSVNDRQFKTSWEDVFLQYPSLRVPWHISKPPSVLV
jgi:tartrate-resistant acid phosphatase type 5